MSNLFEPKIIPDAMLSINTSHPASLLIRGLEKQLNRSRIPISRSEDLGDTPFHEKYVIPSFGSSIILIFVVSMAVGIFFVARTCHRRIIVNVRPSTATPVTTDEGGPY